MSKLERKLGVGRHFLIGVFAMALLAVVLITNYTGGLRGLFSPGGTEVTADFRNTASLALGDPVRVRGVAVGEVTKTAPLPGARGTRVTMTMKDDALPLYQDVRARIAWRSLLGGAFVVEVEPGTEGSGELDGPIPVARTTSQVELDDITAIAQGDARDGLRQLQPELAAALDDPASTKDLATTLADVAPDVEQGVGALRGVQQDKDLRDLVSATADTMESLDNPTPLRTLVASGGLTLETTARRAAEIRTTLREAPQAMDNTNATLAELDGTLDALDPLLGDLRAPAGDVAPTLRALNPVVAGADRLLGNARPLLGRLRPAVRDLATVGRQGVPLLNEFEPSLVRFDDTILPYMNEVDPETQHTAAEMVGPGAGGLALVATQLDPNGHYLRFPALAGSGSFYLPCQTFAGDPSADKFIECKNINELIDTYLSYDPSAPAPGVEGNPARSGK